MANDKRIEDLSDDELASMTPEQFATLASGQEDLSQHGGEDDSGKEEDQSNEDPAIKAEEKEANTKQGDANEDPSTKEDGSTDSAEAGSGNDATAGEGKEAKDPSKDAPVDKATAKVEEKQSEPKQVDAIEAMAQLDALYAPFKANGREMKVQSVEEARQLMSMGANYNKKMQGMKPHLSTLRMLENAKIGQNELNYLIDLHRRDPVAINKLIQDSGIDPMDLSAEKAASYTPSDHRPNAAEIDLDVVLEELKDSESFSRTIDVVQNKMDAKSKQAVAQAPAILKVLNTQVENGIYDLVQAEVDRQRMFGRLTGLSDLEAYRQVGDVMNEEGKFAHLVPGQGQQGQRTLPPKVITPPNPKKAEDESKRNDAKRAVAPTRTAAGAVAKPDFNPLSMSDEEFAKLGGKF